MSYYCSCDYDRPEFISETAVKARKAHECVECGATIAPGETYRRIVGKWDGEISQYTWCTACCDVHAYITAHVPCFCWLYTTLHDDALACAAEAGKEAPGLWFGVARRVVKATRRGKEMPR